MYEVTARYFSWKPEFVYMTLSTESLKGIRQPKWGEPSPQKWSNLAGTRVNGRGGGTFVNMESPPGMPANATITIQRTPSLLHYNRILIRVLKGCSIASGDEILVDKQSYGTAFSKAVAMGSKRIDPPGAVSNSLPRAAPEDELPAESAPAPAPAVGAPE